MERELRTAFAKPQLIRAYLLEIKDVFEMFQTQYIVAKISKGIIYYCHHYRDINWEGNIYTMGTNCQQWVKLLYNKCEYYVR